MRIWFDLPRPQALHRIAIMMAGLGPIGITGGAVHFYLASPEILFVPAAH